MEENTAIELIQMNGEVRVDSRIIAKGIGVKHPNLMQTIYTYQSELEKFGQLLFETEVGERPQGGGNPQRYALLNRNQIGVATSLSRNTPEVVSFKVALFKKIDEMEEHIHSLHKQIALTEAKMREFFDRIHQLTQRSRMDDVDYAIAPIALHRLTRDLSNLEDVLAKAPKHLKQDDIAKVFLLLRDIKKQTNQLADHLKVEEATHNLLLVMHTGRHAQKALSLAQNRGLLAAPADFDEEEDDEDFL